MASTTVESKIDDNLQVVQDRVFEGRKRQVRYRRMVE